MESNTASTKTDWLLFIVSTIAMVAMLIWADEWFWVALPFVLTYFVRALRMM